MPLARALDRIQCGVIATSCSMRPSFVNKYAHQVLECRDALALENGSLRTHSADDQRTLTGLVSRAANSELDHGVTVWLRSADPAKRLVLHVVGDNSATADREAILHSFATRRKRSPSTTPRCARSTDSLERRRRL